MNNFEHIMQGGIDELMDCFGYDVNNCVCYVKCENCAFTVRECNNGTCRDGFRAWLEVEYVEPDSWDKLLDDLVCTEQSCNYFGHGENNPTCKECPADPAKTEETCTKMMALDIADRIRKLRDVE